MIPCIFVCLKNGWCIHRVWIAVHLSKLCCCVLYTRQPEPTDIGNDAANNVKDEKPSTNIISSVAAWKNMPQESKWKENENIMVHSVQRVSSAQCLFTIIQSSFFCRSLSSICLELVVRSHFWHIQRDWERVSSYTEQTPDTQFMLSSYDIGIEWQKLPEYIMKKASLGEKKQLKNLQYHTYTNRYIYIFYSSVQMLTDNFHLQKWGAISFFSKHSIEMLSEERVRKKYG